MGGDEVPTFIERIRGKPQIVNAIVKT